MKRGVFIILLIIFSLILIYPNSSLTCTKKGIIICYTEYYCTNSQDKTIVESIMGSDWCGCTLGPTCSDGIQNQGETGVDCGGPCSSACQPSTCSGSWNEVAKCVCEKKYGVCYDGYSRWNSQENMQGYHYYYASHNDGCSSGTPGDIKQETSGCIEPCKGRFDLNGNIQTGASCGTAPSLPQQTKCGNYICETGETCKNCEDDCGSCQPQTYCTDGLCNGGETCSSCPQDCGSCCNPNYGKTCSSPQNACNQVNTGTIQCDGSCSATIPAVPANYGKPCGCKGTYDCSGNCVGDSLPVTYYRDADSDNYGILSVSQTLCTKPAGFVTNNQDCNDNNKNIYPGAPENNPTLCSDGIDNNCNNLIDCVDPNCAGITKTNGQTCCTSYTQCPSDKTCENYVCVTPSKTGNPTCCYTYTECISEAQKNKGKSTKWPQQGDCAPHGITENPECY